MSAFWVPVPTRKVNNGQEPIPRRADATRTEQLYRSSATSKRPKNRNTALERLERPISITEDRDRSRESSGQLAAVTIRVAMFVAHRSGAWRSLAARIGLAPHDGSRTSSGPMSQARFLKSSCHAPSAPAHRAAGRRRRPAQPSSMYAAATLDGDDHRLALTVCKPDINRTSTPPTCLTISSAGAGSCPPLARERTA